MMEGTFSYKGEYLGVIDRRDAYVFGNHKGGPGLYVLPEEIDDAQGFMWLRKDGSWGDVSEGHFWDTKDDLLADIKHVLEAPQ